MTQKNWNKIYVFGIITILTIMAVTPSMITADPSGTVELNEYRWDGLEIIEYDICITPNEYNAFNSDFESCQTVEEVWTVYQNYGIVPTDKSLGDFRTWSEIEYIENQGIIEHYQSTYTPYDPSEQYYEGFFVAAHGIVNPISICIMAGYLYVYFASDFGGYVKFIGLDPFMTGIWESEDEYDCDYTIWIGRIEPIPNVINFKTINYWIVSYEATIDLM